jgi:hypothetical protein
MIAKTHSLSSAVAHGLERPSAPVWHTPPLDADERLKRIAALGERIAGYVAFMCQSSGAESSSAEAKDKALALFYEKLSLVERQLARIHDAFQLV